MKRFTMLAMIVALFSFAAFNGCQKRDSKVQPATELNQHDGHDHSAHSKDDGHGH